MPLDPCQSDPEYRRRMAFVSQMLTGQVEGVKVLNNNMVLIDNNCQNFAAAEVALKTAGWYRDPGPATTMFVWIGPEKWSNPCAGLSSFI